MPVWLGGGVGPIQQDVLSQSSVESTSREIAWVYDPGTEVPENAFFVFENEDQKEVFIGRTVLDGDLVPGMILQDSDENGVQETLFAQNGRVFSSQDKQVLCGRNMKWVPRLPDKIHPNAVIGGRLSTGDVTYIGLALIDGVKLIGRVDPTRNRNLFVPYNDQEIALSDYKILIEGI